MSRSVHAEQSEWLLYNHHLHQFLTSLKHERGFADATIVNLERSLKFFLAWLVAQYPPLATMSPVIQISGRPCKERCVSFAFITLRAL